MTAIVGIVDGRRVIIGADSAGLSGWHSVARKDEKVFRTGPFIMGFTTSFRMGQLLRYAFVPPDRREEEPVDRFMATTFIDAVRACLKAGGWAEKKNEKEECGTFLVGYAGRLFEVSDDYQVGESLCGYAAAGCGRELAMGSLYSTEGSPARDRVLKALGAAAEFSGGVRPPFNLVELE